MGTNEPVYVPTREAGAVLARTGFAKSRYDASGDCTMHLDATEHGLALSIEDCHVANCHVTSDGVVFDLDDFRVTVEPRSCDLRSIVDRDEAAKIVGVANIATMMAGSPE